MHTLKEHPAVVKFWEKNNSGIKPVQNAKLEAKWLRTLCFDAGADDVGFVEIDRKEIAGQQADILADLPNTKSIIMLAFRMNRQNIRTPASSIGNNPDSLTAQIPFCSSVETTFRSTLLR